MRDTMNGFNDDVGNRQYMDDCSYYFLFFNTTTKYLMARNPIQRTKENRSYVLKGLPSVKVRVVVIVTTIINSMHNLIKNGSCFDYFPREIPFLRNFVFIPIHGVQGYLSCA